MNHLVILAEDYTLRSSDKQKLKGYIKMWKNSKVLLGSAVFAEIPKDGWNPQCSAIKM